MGRSLSWKEDVATGWQVAWPCASPDVKRGGLGAAERQVLQNFNLLIALGW